jgi:hypothetical protein
VKVEPAKRSIADATAMSRRLHIALSDHPQGVSMTLPLDAGAIANGSIDVRRAAA